MESYFQKNHKPPDDYFCKLKDYKRPYLELFWSVFSPNAGKYGPE